MSLKVSLYEDINVQVPYPVVGRMSQVAISNAAVGGFLSMAARCEADPVALLEMVGRLGWRVDVRDAMGRLCWQGQLTEVEVHTTGYTFAYSLDDLVNAVKVVYSTFEDDGETAVGLRPETDWATNATSISTYGRKEAVLSMSGMDAAEAGLLRDRYLALYDQPLLQQHLTAEEVRAPYAWLRGRGYHWTCTWQVYNQSAEGDRATGTQIQDIVTAECPFIASTDVAATGVSVERFRDANQTAWREMLRLAALGDSSHNPLFCGVWEDRKLVVSAMPTEVGYLLRRNGRYLGSYREVVDPWLLRAGRILRLPEMVPGGVFFTPKLDDPRNVLIKEVSYNEAIGEPKIVPFEAKDVADQIVGTFEPWR